MLYMLLRTICLLERDGVTHWAIGLEGEEVDARFEHTLDRGASFDGYGALNTRSVRLRQVELHGARLFFVFKKIFVFKKNGYSLFFFDAKRAPVDAIFGRNEVVLLCRFERLRLSVNAHTV